MTTVGMQQEVRRLLRHNGQFRTTPVSLSEFITLSAGKLKHVRPDYVSVLYDRYTNALPAAEDVKTYGQLVGIPPVGSTTVLFYTSRGWTEDEALDKIQIRQSTNSVSSMCTRHQVSPEEARDIITRRAERGLDTLRDTYGADNVRARKQITFTSTKQQFFTDMSVDLDISVAEAKTLHSQRAATIRSQKIATGELIVVSPTQLQYYLNQGLTTEEAALALSDRQRTFSLTKCIDAHGADAGTKIWQARQDKWMATMNGKSDEDKRRILEAKVAGSRFVSQASRKFFDGIIPHISADLTVFTDDMEYFINANGKFWKYDFTIPELKLIIEYNGQHVHPREDSPDTWIHAYTRLSKADALAHDRSKHEAAIARGFRVEYVWHSDNLAHKTAEMIHLINHSQQDITQC